MKVPSVYKVNLPRGKEFRSELPVGPILRIKNRGLKKRGDALLSNFLREQQRNELAVRRVQLVSRRLIRCVTRFDEHVLLPIGYFHDPFFFLGASLPALIN